MARAARPGCSPPWAEAVLVPVSFGCGALGTDQSAVMNGHISAAYETATGAAPVNGALAGFVDLWNAMPQVAVYWADQGIWRGLMDGAFFS